ncbi:conserved Plasmodium protein, unknown function [Plasmodium gallinaceum]|uniref:Uncharacterized protein n=1 Tax=Plasmodium gallinaceum TaxID=5849 RepID=A0A1J1GV60_PLAGA|nr:conserved Plasmodium protein, unknown function [Plasmodium gallinaceum]CRG95185.1 conserved Plasmodium protein, unknown function [Plasmodium gallinaceum]
MKERKLLILKNNDPLKKKINFFFLSLRKYDNSKINNKEKEDDYYTKRENDIFKYFDGNKNIIKTTSYILKEHLNNFLFIKQQGNFYNYFYNSYPFIINRYVNYIKENYAREKNKEDKEQKSNDTAKYNNIENTNYLFLFHYYNGNTKNEIENEKFLNFVNKNINYHNVTKFLKCLKENIYMNRKTNKNENMKLNLIFQNIIDKINDTNDINKKIEVLLYIASICDKNSSPVLFSNIKKYIQEIYEVLMKKTKKGVIEQYLIFLLYKEFLSSKNEKYMKVDIKNYLSEEISFYNYLKNENINIFLLSLIYRDLSFLNNHELKYVLMNLAFSKIKNFDFFTNLDTHNIFLRNKNNNLNNSLHTFFSSSLLRNNFFSFLKNYDYIDYSGVINYSKDLNFNDLNNYICHNLLTAIIQLNHSQNKCYDLIQLFKKKYFLDNEKNTMLFNYILKVKDNMDYMNEFIVNNVMYLTKYLFKNKSGFSNNLYFNIMKVYCNFLTDIKNSEIYDLKKKNSLINDSRKTINYCINEIYHNINLYTLKEFISFIDLIKKLPANFSFELKNEVDNSNKIKKVLYKDKKGENLFISKVLHFNIDEINKENIENTDEKNILLKQNKLGDDNFNETDNILNNVNNKMNRSIDEEGEDVGITEKVSFNISNKYDKHNKEELENNKNDSNPYFFSKNNLKTKKNVTIINKEDFIILILLSIFDEISEEFVLKIKEKELYLMKEKKKDNIFEYIYENHYKLFLNNSSSYIEHINEKYDEITKEQIINYFVLFTHINKLDIYELCLLVNAMNEINKFHKFIDFFISRHIEKILYKEFKGDHINEEIGFNYEFSENYLDNYISKVNEKKEKLESVPNTVENKSSNSNKQIEKHFDEINLSAHTPYSSNFEKYYYEYDIITSTINLFLILNENSITKYTIAKYLKYIDYNKVNVLKININSFFQKSNIDKKMRKDNEIHVYNENLDEKIKSEKMNDSFYFDKKLFYINSYDCNIMKNDFYNKNNSNYMEERGISYTPLNNVIIYNIVENRLKYDINLKNHLLHKENYEKEEIKYFFEKEMLTLNNIANLMNYINHINDDMKYMNLLTLILKNMILCKNEIVEIKTYRTLTTFLLNIKNFYQKINMQSQYSYLNMLIMYYVKSIETFMPFFYFSDYLKTMQVFIKYDIAKNYLKYLITLNNELNKTNIKNINLYFVHIILYLYLKLNYINENFLSNLLQYYINSLHQRINNMNVNIIENLMKTNELLISLCIKNKNMIHFNYMLIQKYGNFSNEFKIDDLDDISENKNFNSLHKNNSNAKFSTTSILNKQFTNSCSSYSAELNENNVEENLNNKEHSNNLFIKENNDNMIKNNINILQSQTNYKSDDDEYFVKNMKNYNDEQNISSYASENVNKNITENSIITQNFKLSFVQKLNIIYFLCKFNFYNDLIKLYYLQLINECMNSKNNNISDEDYCKLYEIYVHVILNFYFISFNKNNKYINFILSNLPCYYWYKREEEKLNLFVSSKQYNDINNILKLLNLNFLIPTLTEIYFIHFFNDVNKTNYSLQIPQNFLYLYQKYNLTIDDIKNKNIAILCIPEEHELRGSNNDKKVLVNESVYIFENIKKTYATSLLYLSEWKNMKTEEKCDYIMRILHSAISN